MQQQRAVESSQSISGLLHPLVRLLYSLLRKQQDVFAA
jgi:hypothetical protein